MHHGKRPHVKIRQMHDEMGLLTFRNIRLMAGDFVRLQPNYISICNLDAVDPVYGHGSRCNKGEMYRRLMTAPDCPASVATETYILIVPSDDRNQTRHNFLRRLMSPSFGPGALKNLEPTMDTYFGQFISGIEQQANRDSGVVYLNKWVHNLTFDVYSSQHISDYRSQVR